MRLAANEGQVEQQTCLIRMAGPQQTIIHDLSGWAAFTRIRIRQQNSLECNPAHPVGRKVFTEHAIKINKSGPF